VAALEEALEVFTGLGDREDIGQLLIRLAMERARVGKTAEAEQDLAAAYRIAHEVGAEDQRIFIKYAHGEIARWAGRLDEARELLDGAIADFERSSQLIHQPHALLVTSRGYLDTVAGNRAGALEWYERALRIALDTRDGPVIARAVELRAEIELRRGDAAAAATLLGTADMLRGISDEANVDVVRIRGAARAALGDQGFAQAYRRGTARSRDEVLAELAAGAEVRCGAGTPAAPAERTPRR
jgi:tetratricopeptide (TPR) repeat protein